MLSNTNFIYTGSSCSDDGASRYDATKGTKNTFMHFSKVVSLYWNNILARFHVTEKLQACIVQGMETVPVYKAFY